jgi:hypothetical protein
MTNRKSYQFNRPHDRLPGRCGLRPYAAAALPAPTGPMASSTRG